MELNPNSIHVWFAFQDTIQDEGLLAAYKGLLDSEEKERYQRYKQPKDKHQFLVAHALVRSVLGGYLSSPAEKLVFKKNHYGRPELVHASDSLQVRFSLSHTKGAIALGVTLDNEIGVDIEHCSRTNDFMNIARRFFAPSEVKDLSEHCEDACRKRFTEYWTLKESYVKAVGKGLHIPLNQFSFDLSGSLPRVSFDAQLSDIAQEWHFQTVCPSVEHIAAVAVRSESSSHSEIKCWKSVPLAESNDLPAI